MLLIVHQCFLMTLSRKIIVFEQTLQTNNKFCFYISLPLYSLFAFRKVKLTFQINESEVNSIFSSLHFPYDINCSNSLFQVFLCTFLIPHHRRTRYVEKAFPYIIITLSSPSLLLD